MVITVFHSLLASILAFSFLVSCRLRPPGQAALKRAELGWLAAGDPPAEAGGKEEHAEAC